MGSLTSVGVIDSSQVPEHLQRIRDRDVQVADAACKTLERPDGGVAGDAHVDRRLLRVRHRHQTGDSQVRLDPCDSHSFGVVGADGIIGELAVLEGQPRSATATAMTDLDTLVMSTAEFAQLLQAVPVAAANLKALRVTRTEKFVALSAAA